jgi:hypothetical protein
VPLSAPLKKDSDDGLNASASASPPGGGPTFRFRYTAPPAAASASGGSNPGPDLVSLVLTPADSLLVQGIPVLTQNFRVEWTRAANGRVSGVKIVL